MKDEVETKSEPTFEDQLKKMVLQAAKPLVDKYKQELDEMEVKTNKLVSELEDKLRAILSQMQHYVCYNCNKDLISGKDAIYTNFAGYKFCSHKCIDENKEKQNESTNQSSSRE